MTDDTKIFRQLSKPFSFDRHAPQNRVYADLTYTPEQIALSRAETDELDMFAEEQSTGEVQPVVDVATGPCGCLQCK